MTFQRALGDESEAGPEETGGAQSRPALCAEGPFRSLPGGGAGVQVPTARVPSAPGLGDAGDGGCSPGPAGRSSPTPGPVLAAHAQEPAAPPRCPLPGARRLQSSLPAPRAGSALTPRVNSMSWRGDDEDGPHGGLLPLLTIHPWAKEPHLRCPSPAWASGGRTSPEPPPRWRGCSGRCPRGSRPRAPGHPPPCDPRASS